MGRGRTLGTRPTVRDVVFVIVAFLAGILALSASVLGVLALVTRGPSFALLVGFLFNVFFWYWISVGAWRRTIWQAPPS